MSVTIKVVGDLRRFVEGETIEVCDAGCSLGVALERFLCLYPQIGRELFDEHGRLHYALVLATGGRRLSWPQDRDVSMEDGQELLLTRFHRGG